MTVYIKDKLPNFYLPDSVDVNIASWLNAQGVYEGKVKVIIPEGIIIGGTIIDNYALNIGNIAAFDSLTIDIAGEVQGKGGLVSGSKGENAIYSVYPVTINVLSTGAIRSGGGAGGKGSIGTTGTYTVTYGPYWAKDSGNDYYFRNPTKARSDELVIAWNGQVTQYLGVGVVSSYGVYYRGTQKIHSNITDWGGYDDWYAISKKETKQQIGGDGGLGGQGQGYLQAWESGDPGKVGVNNAGDGGDGGNGGNWGFDGTKGEDAKYTGELGGEAGYAIYAYEGPATGIVVNNNGIIDGRTYY